MPGLILAIDQGTTNTKAMLVAKNGRPVFRASVPVSLLTARAGFVEQDPLELWESVVDVIQQCLMYANNDNIEGIAISNQRETAVAWDRTSGEPVANAISWQCRRGEKICDELKEYSGIIRAKSGLPLDPLVSASKWAWLLRQDLSLGKQAEEGTLCLGNVDSWVLYKLTGLHTTDHTNASRTALLNLETMQWDAELLKLFKVPLAALPELRVSSGIFGSVNSIPQLQGIPVVSLIGDSHAAMAGHGSYRAGTAKATYGTGSSLMTLTPSIPAFTDKLARTVAWSTAAGVQYALEGNITMTGSGVQWVGEFLGLDDPTDGAIELAESVKNSDGVYFVPAMVGLGAPYWDSTTRGTLTGLSRNSTRAHMARAAVDAIAFQIADVFYAMQNSADISLPALHTDGGATRNSALMQFQSDLLQLPVYRSTCEDLSALGAAWLGGLALGWWKNLSDLEQLSQDSTTFFPDASVETSYSGWKHAVAQARLKEMPA